MSQDQEFWPLASKLIHSGIIKISCRISFFSLTVITFRYNFACIVTRPAKELNVANGHTMQFHLWRRCFGRFRVAYDLGILALKSASFRVFVSGELPRLVLKSREKSI